MTKRSNEMILTLSLKEKGRLFRISSGQQPDRTVEKHLFNAVVANLKKQVKPEHYQLFDLYVIQKWPVRKITQTLGVNAGQVYLAKHRISSLLKKEIAQLEKE